MTAASANFKTRLANWREWEMNPVLLKELRQAMRNQFLIGALMMVLATLFLTCVAILTRQKFLPREETSLGLFIFRALLGILTAISLVFIPLYVGIRIALERLEARLDLMFATTLTPRRIVRGKLFCGVYLAGLFFSLCLPFMAFTTLLRGVDLPTICVVLACLFEAVCLAVQAAILLASFPIPTRFKILLGLLFGCGLIIAGWGVFWLCSSLLSSGVGASTGGRKFWVGFIAIFLLVMGGVWLLYAWAVDLVAADHRPRGDYGVVIHRPTLDQLEAAERQAEISTAGAHPETA